MTGASHIERARADADAHDARKMLDALPDWIARFDAELRCVDLNLAVASAAGADRTDLIGRMAADLGTGAPFDARWFAMLQAARDAARPAESSLMVDRRNEVRLYHVRITPELGPDREVEHLLCTATDITASATRQTVLRSANRLARMQQVTSSFSQAKTPLEVADVLVSQGCQALRADAGLVMFLNAEGTHLELARALGYPPEAVEMWRTLPVDANAPLSEVTRTGFAEFFETHEAVLERYPHLADQRHAVDEALAAIPLTVEDRTLGAIGLVFHNETPFTADDRAFALALAAQCAQALERARLFEAEARARGEAEAANRMKDEFLATMSHELRTPLQAIFGWVALLRNKRLDPTTYQRAIESIDKAAKSQARLIDDIFDVSRIISGKVSLTYGEVDIAKVISSAVDLARPAAAAKHIVLNVAIDGGGILRADGDRLQQVVANLVGNAVKFTPAGGHVEVTVGRTPTAVRLRVTDSGEGIARELLPHVFERFRQGDSSTTRRHGGLGLGLAIVRHLVELHGGTVHADSPGPGQGATFGVEIPASPADGHEQSSPAPISGVSVAPRDLVGVRVLLVDDDPGGREAAAALLGARGAQVTSAASAHEALAQLRTQPLDVLVCDIGMPEVDGYQLMKQVRSLGAERGGTTPAVALTAYASTDDVRRALAAGFAAHVAKPMDAETLVGAIIDVRRGKATQPARWS